MDENMSDKPLYVEMCEITLKRNPTQLAGPDAPTHPRPRRDHHPSSKTLKVNNLFYAINKLLELCHRRF